VASPEHGTGIKSALVAPSRASSLTVAISSRGGWRRRVPRIRARAEALVAVFDRREREPAIAAQRRTREWRVVGEYIVLRFPERAGWDIHGACNLSIPTSSER
jgi:hypothetical protein